MLNLRKLLQQVAETKHLLVGTCKLRRGLSCFELLRYDFSSELGHFCNLEVKLTSVLILIRMQYVSLSLIICEGASNKVAKCAHQNKWHFGDPEESCSRISSLL